MNGNTEMNIKNIERAGNSHQYEISSRSLPLLYENNLMGAETFAEQAMQTFGKAQTNLTLFVP